MYRARVRLPVELEGLLKRDLEEAIDQANLGELDTLIAQRYLIDQVPQIDIATEIGSRSPDWVGAFFVSSAIPRNHCSVHPKNAQIFRMISCSGTTSWPASYFFFQTLTVPRLNPAFVAAVDGAIFLDAHNSIYRS